VDDDRFKLGKHGGIAVSLDEVTISQGEGGECRG
jgi:hypothetical protein